MALKRCMSELKAKTQRLDDEAAKKGSDARLDKIIKAREAEELSAQEGIEECEARFKELINYQARLIYR